MGLGLGGKDLDRLIDTAPQRYKAYQIEKRSGGTRWIAQPARELKAAQRIIMKTYLSRLPVHASATAYVPARNIAYNASMHKNNSSILKLDFSNFFNSLKVEDWDQYQADRADNLGDADLRLLRMLLFWGSGQKKPVCLSIGAPSSPIISNALLCGLDEKLSSIAESIGIVYTRYADDITASAMNIEALISFETCVRQEVAGLLWPRLQFNEKKRGIYTRGERRMVTGLIVTPDGQISLGRQRKRLISAMLHKASIGKLNDQELSILRGYIGFAKDVEPEFVTRMWRKYAVLDNERFGWIAGNDAPRKQ